jgi:tRNA pseudouridine13 synthase
VTRGGVRIRRRPEDFRVDEVPLYPAAGSGDHTFLRVEKRLRTTEQVARALARAAGVRPRDVGYAGRKDRVAVTTQWLSVPGLDPKRALGLSLPGARVLEAVRHPHKLRTGQLRGNRFDILVHGVDADLHVAVAGRLEDILARGLENRFGAQRFGRGGQNLARARRLLRGERSAPRGRETRFLWSVLQAAVFDAVLRDRPAPPDVLLPGDVAVRHDSGGLFVVDDPAAEATRARAFEISPTGPIFGTREISPEGEVAARERAALEAHGIDPDDLPRPRGVRLRGARRPLRVRPTEASLTRCATGARLRFVLPPGSYATVLIETLLGTAPDEGPGDGLE